MQFEKGYLYHIYNQGNNKQKVFFERENYLFFLKKIKLYILPYADIIAWCLMPNHFHLMVFVKEIEVAVALEDFVRKGGLGEKSHNQTEEFYKTPLKQRTINNSVGLMLRSYTNAINKQQNRSGALFRRKTKAECVNCPKGITPSFIMDGGITQMNISNPEKQYPQVCFKYIHQNPVKAGLVKSDLDWEYSSAIDYFGSRGGHLINKSVAKEYINL